MTGVPQHILAEAYALQHRQTERERLLDELAPFPGFGSSDGYRSGDDVRSWWDRRLDAESKRRAMRCLSNEELMALVQGHRRFVRAA